MKDAPKVRRALLLLGAVVVLFALAIFALDRASKGPELRVGSTLNDPWKYFVEQVEARPDGRFKQTLCGLPLIDESEGTVVNYVTRFSYSPNHAIASRTFAYEFDTNGTLMRVTSQWAFPIVGF